MPDLTLKKGIETINVGFIAFNLVFSKMREVFTVSEILAEAAMHGLNIESSKMEKAIEDMALNQMVFHVYGGYKQRLN